MAILARFGDSYEVNNNLEELDNSENASCLASIDELLHLLCVYKLKNWGFQNKNVKEADVQSIFGQLALYFEKLTSERTCGL
jgi:hypothetical protein